MKYCKSCSKYTLKEICSTCNEKTSLLKPPKWSPEDPYGSYRRKFKKEVLGK